MTSPVISAILRAGPGWPRSLKTLPEKGMPDVRYLSYAIVFAANFYTSLRIFGLGWSAEPASFMKEFGVVALITAIAGMAAALPKKADWKIIAVSSAFGPSTICGLMAQAILTKQSPLPLHWVAVPVAGAALSLLSFLACEKLFRRR